MEPDLLVANGNGLLSLSVETPKSSRSGILTTSAVFDAELSGESITVIFEMALSLTGILNFQQGTQTLLLDDENELQTFDIPITSTVPAAEYELDFDGNFVFADAKVEKDGSISVLKLTLDRSVIEKSGGFGKLTIRDKNSGTNDFTHLLVEFEQQIQIIPHTLRFSRVEESYSGRAVLRVAATEGAKAVSVRAWLGDVPIKARTRKLNNQVMKIELIVPEEHAPRTTNGKSQGEVQWEIMTSTGKSILKSPTVFSHFQSKE